MLRLFELTFCFLDFMEPRPVLGGTEIHCSWVSRQTRVLPETHQPAKVPLVVPPRPF